MTRAGRYSRRAVLGLALASLPVLAYGRMVEDESAPASGGGRAWHGRSLRTPYGPSYGDRPVRVLTQLHTHTTGSDGARTPAEVTSYYRGAGYRALVLTDHDVLTRQPSGLEAPILGSELSPA